MDMTFNINIVHTNIISMRLYAITSYLYNITGLLDPPPGMRVDKLNSTALFLSWNPPSTLSGIPILYYSVDVNNLVSTTTINVTVADQPSINPTTTSLDLSRLGSIGYLYGLDCESLMFTVRAWNSVGGGAGSVVFYSQGIYLV